MDNRTRILQVALTLFSQRGYDAVGVQEIVAAAGVSKPTMYHYFNNKRGLLERLLADFGEQLLERLREKAVYHGDLVVTLRELMHCYFDFAASHQELYRFVLASYFAAPSSEQNAISRYWLERQHHLLEQLFETAATQHGNMVGRQRAYAATFVGMVHTYIGMFSNGYVQLSEELSRQALHQFMHGIFS